MRMKKYIFAISFITLFLVGTAYADFAPADFQYVRPINMGNNIKLPGTYVKFDVDRTVSTLSRTDLADLRIIDGSGGEVPYQLVTENEQVRTDYVPVTMRDLSVKNGETMFMLDLGVNGTIHDHVVINSSSKNFKRPVAIYASDTAIGHFDKGWRLLSDTNNIYNFYDQALGFNAGSGDVYYPESTSRYMRVVIGRGEGSDVRVESAKVLRILLRDATKSHMNESDTVTQNANERSTEILVDLGGAGIATRKITLTPSVDTQNFSRRVVIQGSNDATSWSLLGQGYVFSLKTALFTGSDFSVVYPESATRFIRVVVFNEDNQPINWENTVAMEGVVRSVVFSANPNMSYSLYYGKGDSRRPQYDIARFFQYIESATLPPVVLGVSAINPAYVPVKAPELPFSERNKNILNGALILLVAMVSFLLISYLKKLKQDTPHN